MAVSKLASPAPSAVVDSFSVVFPPDDGDALGVGLGDALAEGLGVALADGLGEELAFALAPVVQLLRLFALAARVRAAGPAPGVTFADVLVV